MFFADDKAGSQHAMRLVKRGDAVRLAPGVFARGNERQAITAVTRHWRAIVAREIPGAVITDRSGPDPRPRAGRLYVSHPTRRRPLHLPGLTVECRIGPGPIEGDLPIAEGLWAASPQRWVLDNTRRSRDRGAGRRTLDDHELATAVDHLASIAEGRLANVRRALEGIADRAGDGVDVARADALLGAAMGTRPDVASASEALTSRQRGRPVDWSRVALFDRAAEELATSPPVEHPSRPAPTLAFFEAYFSNYIEGTTFELFEAANIVMRGHRPENRAHDTSDVLSTFELATDAVAAEVASDGEEFVELILRRHARLMAHRPGTEPGRIKSIRNRVGDHMFVDPAHVYGTLLAGWERIAGLRSPFQRAVMTHLVVVETHPFIDGNGRIARLGLNAELSAGGQLRLVIPTVFRNDYFAGLRAVTVNGLIDPHVQIMRFAWDWTASVDWTDYASAEADLVASNALEPPEAADEGHGLRRVEHIGLARPLPAQPFRLSP